MGKILIRIYPNELTIKIPTLLNKHLDVVLFDNTVIHGELISFEKDKIIIKHNHYRRKHTIVLSEIAEIVLDQEKSC